MASISSFGAYIPRRRLSREVIAAANSWSNPALRALGKGERSTCNWDEDTVTMAVEAARDCLGSRPPEQLLSVLLATTSPPFEERANSGIVAQAIGFGGRCGAIDITSTERAGVSALIAACDSAQARRGPVLCVASEKRRSPVGSTQELLFGDGAAALLVQPDDGIARLLGSHSVCVDFVDHYRGQGGEFGYYWEERWIRDEGYMKLVTPVLRQLLDRTGVRAEDVTHFCFPCTMPRVSQQIAKQAGIPLESVRSNLDGVCGDTGAAHALLMFVHALEEAKPGDKILVAGFGQGCDAALFEVTGTLAQDRRPVLGVRGSLDRRKEDRNYARWLAINDLVKLDKGPRSELDKQTPLTTTYRHRDMLYTLVGGRCEACGTLQFPKSNVCVAPECGARGRQIDQSFADFAGRVKSWVPDMLTYTPDPPAYYGMVEFSEGGRMMVDFTDVDAGEVDVGTSMRMVFRIKDIDTRRGFTRYFWKAAPLFPGKE